MLLPQLHLAQDDCRGSHFERADRLRPPHEEEPVQIEGGAEEAEVGEATVRGVREECEERADSRERKRGSVHLRVLRLPYLRISRQKALGGTSDRREASAPAQSRQLPDQV